jgi:hypothetical protein
MQLNVVRSFHLGIVLTIALASWCAPALQRAVRAADSVKPHVDDRSSLLAESVQKHKLPGMAAATIDGGRIVGQTHGPSPRAAEMSTAARANS